MVSYSVDWRPGPFVARPRAAPVGLPGLGLALGLGGRRGRTVPDVDEHQILTQINDLVSQEHNLRTQLSAGELSSQEEHDRLAALEGALDQCWDLLRQRRAKREFGQDVAEAKPRDVETVEKYLQ